MIGKGREDKWRRRKKVKDKQRIKMKAKKVQAEIKKYKEMDSDVLYICTECGENEEIPMDAVMQFDILDDGDIADPPTFSCEKCGGIYTLGTPIKYKGKMAIPISKAKVVK